MTNEGISSLKTITMGPKLQLKKESFKDVRVREWLFSGVEKGKLVLSRAEGFILKVSLEDIEWEFVNSPKVED